MTSDRRDLLVTDADGKNERFLVSGTAFWDAAVSPNRKWIAFTGQPTGQQRGLYVVRVDGTEQQLLVKDTADSYAGAVAFDPSGRYCAFTRRTPGREGTVPTRLSIFDLTTGTQRLLTSGIRDSITDLSWDPLNRFIAFNGQTSDGQTAQLALISPQGGAPQIRNAVGMSFTFNSDGTKLYYLNTDSSREQVIMSYDVASGSVSPVTTEVADMRSFIDPSGLYLYGRFRFVSEFVWSRKNLETGELVRLDSAGARLFAVAGGPR